MEITIKEYNNEGEELVFNSPSPVVLSTFTYSSNRMSVPTFSCTFKHEDFLIFNGKQYIKFNGERYYFRKLPTHKKDNTLLLYEYSATLESERDVLNNVYFYDVATSGYDKYFTESSSFAFNGTIIELSDRINASLSKSGLNYTTVVDSSVNNDLYSFSFTDSSLLAAIGKAFEVAEVQFYFDGKTIHFGEPPFKIEEDYTETLDNGTKITQKREAVFEYGAENELLSIQRSDSGNAIVSRCTGVGSSENIPYYYPNNSADGDISYSVSGLNGASVSYVGFNKIKETFSLYEGLALTCQLQPVIKGSSLQVTNNSDGVTSYYVESEYNNNKYITSYFNAVCEIDAGLYKTYVLVKIDNSVSSGVDDGLKSSAAIIEESSLDTSNGYEPYLLSPSGEKIYPSEDHLSDEPNEFFFDLPEAVIYELHYTVKVKSLNSEFDPDSSIKVLDKGDRYKIIVNSNVEATAYEFDKKVWTDGVNYVPVSNSGITIKGEIPIGAVFTINKIDKMKSMPYLMPPIYRESYGAERFYNATNGLYEINGEPVVFTNEYDETNPVESIQEFDVKPTIANVTNASGEYIDEILEVAYDLNDNNDGELSDDGSISRYYHPYFYIKLRKFDGDYGFNIFDSSLAKDSMSIVMKTGSCASYTFNIQTIESADTSGNTLYLNPVLTDGNGNLISGDYTDRLAASGSQIIDNQQDSSKDSIWIAVEKDTTAVTNDMFPNKDKGIEPKTGDTFVISNIELPQAYIYAAENKLKERIVDFLVENNESRFNLSIKFSRVYLALNENILNQLNEYAKIKVALNNSEYSVYISNFQYKYTNTEVLPEITVQLTDIVGASSNALSKYAAAIEDGVFTRVIDRIGDSSNSSNSQISEATLKAIGDKRYIRNDIENSASAVITFLKGLQSYGPSSFDRIKIKDLISSNDFVSGFPEGKGWALFFKSFINAAGVVESKSSLEIDNLTVRGSFKVYEMIISQLVGENGTRITTDMMKVLNVDTTSKTIYLDTEKGVLYNPFREGDIIMVQHFGSDLTSKTYEFEVESVYVGSEDLGEWRIDNIKYKNFVGDESDIKAKDVLTRVDSVSDSDRKGIIKTTSVEEGGPYIDIIYGLKTDTSNSLRARFGNLNKIIDESFGLLEGFGLYCDNVYLKGIFKLDTGEDIKTKFEITEGLINSSMSSVANEIDRDKNYLVCNIYKGDISDWVRGGNPYLFNVASKLFTLNDTFFANKESVTGVKPYNGKYVLQIKNSYAKQLSTSYVKEPEFIEIEDVEDDGNVVNTGVYKANEFYISFEYVVKSAGTLHIYFEGEDSTGFEEYEKIDYTIALEASDELKEFSTSGYWNGTGDIRIEFTGDIYVDRIVLYDDPLEVIDAKYSSMFTRTDKQYESTYTKISTVDGRVTTNSSRISQTASTLSATVSSVSTIDGRVSTNSSNISLNDKNIKLKVDADGVIAAINLSPETVTIDAKYINLTGKVTIGDLDQTLITGDKISAGAIAVEDIIAEQLDCTTGHIGGFSISESGLSSFNGYMNIYSKIGIKFTSLDGKTSASLGSGFIPETAVINYCIEATNVINSGTPIGQGVSDNGACVRLKVGQATSFQYQQRWISGVHASSNGYGSGFFIGSLYAGDANAAERVGLNFSNLLKRSQLETISGTHTFKNLQYDISSGYVVWDD